MILAILWTIIGSSWTIFWKKALEYNVNKHIFSIFAYFSIFIIAPWLFILWKINLENIKLKYILIIFSIIILSFFQRILSQKSYSIDKLSILIPYENINKILSIILWFLIFGNISNISLWLSILASIIIIIFSIDKKT